MVGMPFPNPSDPELLERMRYLDCKEDASTETQQQQQQQQQQVASMIPVRASL